LVPESVRVPVSPDVLPLVSVLMGVSMGSAIDTLPAPMIVSVGVLVVASNALPDVVSKVNVSASLPTEVFAPSSTLPVIVLLFETPTVSRLRIAPVLELPVPEMVNDSGIERLDPLMCTAPLVTSVRTLASPNEELAVATTTPADTVVRPE